MFTRHIPNTSSKPWSFMNVTNTVNKCTDSTNTGRWRARVPRS